MMNKKYIPGDLVMTDGVPIGTKKGVVYVVTASNPNRTETFESGKVLKGTVTLDNTDDLDYKKEGFLYVECCAWVKDIVPIPLTPAILEANGWKISQVKDNEYYQHYPFINVKVAIKDKIALFFDAKNPTKFSFNNSPIHLDIQFVHQLQHLLFGLGLPSELKYDMQK